MQRKRQRNARKGQAKAKIQQAKRWVERQKSKKGVIHITRNDHWSDHP